jgi:kelch-like protein 9/13
VYDAHRVQYKVPHLGGFFTEAINTEFTDNLFEFAAVASLGNFLFAAGGYCRHSWCSSPAFYSYNPRNRLWAQLSSMNRPRVSFSLCPAEKGLYAIAGIEHIVDDGRDQEIILNCIEFYNPVENLWKCVATLPFGCFNCAAAMANDKLYISGGITDDPENNVPVNHMHMFTPRQDSWDVKARMIIERHCHAMVAHGKKLFVFGGYTTGLDTMSFEICRQNEVYDIETNQWTLLNETPMELGRIHPTSCIVNDVIWLLSGTGDDRFLHRYNVEEDRIEEGEGCGPHVQRMVPLKVAFPADIM